MQSVTVLLGKFHSIFCKKISIDISSLQIDIQLQSIFHKIICSRNVCVELF